MTIASLAELLRQHVGHRCHVVEPIPGRSLAIKCSTCDGRLVDLSSAVGLRPSTARPTSTSTAPEPRRDPTPAETCPVHPGEFRTACRCCAADTKALKPSDPPPVSQVRNGADPSDIPEWQAAKQRLAQREAARRREARAAAVSPPRGTVHLDAPTPEDTP